MEILSPLTGRAVPLSEVPDEVFAEGMAGPGAAVVPGGSGEAIAPVGGTLVKLFEGGHAFGIETDEGLELIVHVGLDTIELRGDGFERLAAEGDRVEAGDPVVRFDAERIRAAGYDPVTPVVVTNPERFGVEGARTGEVAAGETLFRVVPAR